MFALIHETRVAQISSQKFPVGGMEWVNITGIDPQPEQGWSYNGSIFSPPPEHIFTVDERRNMAYPPMNDQLEAIWKQLLSERLGGKSLDPETDIMLDAIEKVKRDHPR